MSWNLKRHSNKKIEEPKKLIKTSKIPTKKKINCHNESEKSITHNDSFIELTVEKVFLLENNSSNCSHNKTNSIRALSSEIKLKRDNDTVYEQKNEMENRLPHQMDNKLSLKKDSKENSKINLALEVISKHTDEMIKRINSVEETCKKDARTSSTFLKEIQKQKVEICAMINVLNSFTNRELSFPPSYNTSMHKDFQIYENDPFGSKYSFSTRKSSPRMKTTVKNMHNEIHTPPEKDDCIGYQSGDSKINDVSKRNKNNESWNVNLQNMKMIQSNDQTRSIQVPSVSSKTSTSSDTTTLIEDSCACNSASEYHTKAEEHCTASIISERLDKCKRIGSKYVLFKCKCGKESFCLKTVGLEPLILSGGHLDKPEKERPRTADKQTSMSDMHDCKKLKKLYSYHQIRPTKYKQKKEQNKRTQYEIRRKHSSCNYNIAHVKCIKEATIDFIQNESESFVESEDEELRNWFESSESLTNNETKLLRSCMNNKSVQACQCKKCKKKDEESSTCPSCGLKNNKLGLGHFIRNVFGKKEIFNKK